MNVTAPSSHVPRVMKCEGLMEGKVLGQFAPPALGSGEESEIILYLSTILLVSNSVFGLKVFTESAPLGRFSHRVAMSVCLFVCLSVCAIGCSFFPGL